MWSACSGLHVKSLSRKAVQFCTARNGRQGLARYMQARVSCSCPWYMQCTIGGRLAVRNTLHQYRSSADMWKHWMQLGWHRTQCSSRACRPCGSRCSAVKLLSRSSGVFCSRGLRMCVFDDDSGEVVQVLTVALRPDEGTPCMFLLRHSCKHVVRRVQSRKVCIRGANNAALDMATSAHHTNFVHSDTSPTAQEHT